MTAQELLTDALKLIETPERWTKCANARDAQGLPVGATDKRAKSFCALGALWRVGSDDLFALSDARTALYRALPYHSITGLNDSPNITHADVVAAFRRAIESLDERTP